MEQTNNSSTIGWTIDRNPDHNIFAIIRNNYRDTSLTDDRNIWYSNWSPDSINYQTNINIINYENINYDNINRNILNINSPWINDPYYNETPISRIRNNRSGNRYFNHINTINTIGSINNNRTFNTSTNINSNEDFIPFDNSRTRNHGINISIINFTVSEEDRQCCICMEERQSEEICRLNCQHAFCVECINQHLQANHSCPICRTSVTTLSVQNNNARDRINL